MSLNVKNREQNSLLSFEEFSRNAYTHGLEAIYTLETIDLKTVRRLAVPSQPEELKTTTFQKHVPFEGQLEFDFGAKYRNWMEPFILDEPIQVLALSKYTEKCLLENGKMTLRCLTLTNFQNLVFIKGIGQGHIDEIQNKLKEYLSGHSLEMCTYIDFYSWVRSLAAALNRKKVYAFMLPYQLADLFPLSPAESVEVRRLTLEKRSEWSQEILEELMAPKRIQHLHEKMKTVADVFISNWMSRRHGFATQQEILERLDRVSTVSTSSDRVLSFFSEVFFKGSFPFKHLLIEDGDSLYFTDENSYRQFCQVTDVALTYFYSKQVFYPLQKLLFLLQKEFAATWKSFPEGFIEKVLRSSHHFRVRKEENGQLIVRLF